MRILTYNVNGLRSAIKKGFMDWLQTDPADVICLQEVKALSTEIDLAALESMGYCTHWFPAQKKGYSGVAIISKPTPDQVFLGDGREQSDFEGRVIRADYGDLTLINAYFPSGTSGDERQSYKYVWLDEFFESMEKLKQERPKLVICGDYNIAHREIDIHNPKGNKKSSGFLPEERAWMDKFLDSGFIDSFRHLNAEPHNYTWWSQRFPSVRKENKGWRIDYISVSTPLESALKAAAILPDAVHSDHCPVVVDLAV